MGKEGELSLRFRTASLWEMYSDFLVKRYYVQIKFLPRYSTPSWVWTMPFLKVGPIAKGFKSQWATRFSWKLILIRQTAYCSFKIWYRHRSFLTEDWLLQGNLTLVILKTCITDACSSLMDHRFHNAEQCFAQLLNILDASSLQVTLTMS